MKKIINRIIFILLFIQCFIVGVRTTSGASMYPTLNETKDYVIVKRLPLLVEADDIVMCYAEGMLICKRIIAVPGDTIEIKNDGLVYVNNIPLDSDYGDSWNSGSYCGVQLILGEDEYFIMGDNRSVSCDSRMFGPIKRYQIIEKVLYDLW